MPEILGYKIKEDNSVRIIDCQLKTSMLNIACNTKFAERDIEDKIRYVIYVYRDGFEIIRTDNIPYLLKLMPWDYMIYPMIVQERQTMSCIRWEMKNE